MFLRLLLTLGGMALAGAAIYALTVRFFNVSSWVDYVDELQDKKSKQALKSVIKNIKENDDVTEISVTTFFDDDTYVTETIAAEEGTNVCKGQVIYA